MAKYLVTGAGGLVGSNFIRYLLGARPGAAVLGAGLNGRERVPEGIEYEQVDLAEGQKVLGLVMRLKPDFIFHLAGAPSSNDWDLLLKANVRTTLSVLDAALEAGRPRVVVVGSAAEYGAVEKAKLPVREDAEAKPITRYAASMLCRTTLVQAYARMGCDAMVGRLFNPLGRDVGEHFAPGSFAKQLRMIAGGKQKPTLQVGNLEAKRDFIDLEDASAAFLAIAEKGRRGETYNVCTGRPCSMGELLEAMAKAKGIKVDAEKDPARIRKSEVSEIYGSTAKLTADTGWRQRVSLEESVRRMLA